MLLQLRSDAAMLLCHADAIRYMRVSAAAITLPDTTLLMFMLLMSITRHIRQALLLLLRCHDVCCRCYYFATLMLIDFSPCHAMPIRCRADACRHAHAMLLALICYATTFFSPYHGLEFALITDAHCHPVFLPCATLMATPDAATLLAVR